MRLKAITNDKRRAGKKSARNDVARHPFPTLIRRRSGCLPPHGVLLCKILKPLYKFIALDLF